MKQWSRNHASRLRMRPILLALALVIVAGCDEEFQPAEDHSAPAPVASGDGPQVDVSVHAANFVPNTPIHTEPAKPLVRHSRSHHHRKPALDLPPPVTVSTDDTAAPENPPQTSDASPVVTGGDQPNPTDPPTTDGGWKHTEKPSDPPATGGG